MKIKAHPKKKYHFVYCVIATGFFIYLTCIFFPFLTFPHTIESWEYVFLLFDHISLFFFYWSFLKVVNTDPGQVPYYWGLFLNDGDYKKRRYCLICHVFKPERCHHCSTCERCVLNMDHHCPWINNCVGFYNRKFFILMLFYAVTTGFITFCGAMSQLWFYAEDIMNDYDDIDTYRWVFISFFLLGFLVNTVLMVMILMFFLTHLQFVLINYTTIENLDRLRTNSQTTINTSFNKGKYYNWIQVFGRNAYLWPFPIFGDSGRPVGDGVIWKILINELDENDKGFHEFQGKERSKSNEKSKDSVENSKINNLENKVSPREEKKDSDNPLLSERNKF